jgi:hypothetical protein
MISTLIGSIIGLFTRALPEIFKFLDKKNERKQELEILKQQTEYAKILHSQKIEEIKTTAQAEADIEAIKAIASMSNKQLEKTGFTWVDTLNAAIRPIITIQWVILLYPGVIVATFILMLLNLDTVSVLDVVSALNTAFGETEKGIAAGIINFWFLHRVLRK